MAVQAPLAPPGAERRSERLARDAISYLEWTPRGRPNGRNALLLHGIQSTALTLARVADRLADEGWRVVAPDLPAHGRSYALDGWDAERPGPLDISRLAVLRHRLSRRHRLRSTAAVVAALAARIGLERPAVIGHSWGASVAPEIGATGLVPSHLVLVDPPFVTTAQARSLGTTAIVEPTTSYEDAHDILATGHPDWDPIDLTAKAEALTRVSTRALVAIVATNTPFDPLPALRRFAGRHPAVPLHVIVGEPAQGSFVSESQRARLRALLGKDHVLVMAGAGHSPHRTHYAEFMTLLLGMLPQSG